MSEPPLRRRWYTDVPAGVRAHEYRDYLTARALGYVSIGFGVVVGAMTVSGVMGSKARTVERARKATLSEVLEGRVPAHEPVRLTGRLTADDVLVLPGEQQRKVLAARLMIQLVGSSPPRRYRREDGPPSRKELPVLKWAQTAAVLRLTDGVHSVALVAPMSALPLKREHQRSPKIDATEVDGADRPTAVIFDGVRIDVPAGALSEFPMKRIRAKAELEVLEPDTQVTVVAAPIRRDDAIVLGSPADSALVVTRGTPSDVTRRRWFFTMTTAGLAVLAVVFGRRRLAYARRLREDFAQRPQQKR